MSDPQPPPIQPPAGGSTSGCSGSVIAIACAAALVGALTVIAIVVAISLPAYKGINKRANEMKDLSDLKQIGLAIGVYAIDHDGMPPASLEILEQSEAAYGGGFETLFYDRKTQERKPIIYLLDGTVPLDDLPPNDIILRQPLDDVRSITVTAGNAAQIERGASSMTR